MVSRSDTSKTIRRRTGGAGKKTGAGINVRDATVGGVRGTTNRPGDWEMVPGTGTSPYNPPEWRKKKKPDTKVTKEKLPPSKDYEGGRTEGMKRRYKDKQADDIIERIASDPNFGAKAGGKVSKSKGGTVKKKYSHGGKIKTKKHHGDQFVIDANGYK